MTPRTVVIVGAGLAGARAAETLRAEGFDGRILLLGDEPFPPYERPALSKEFLAGTRDEESLLLRSASHWSDRSVELRLGRPVTGVDAARRVVRTKHGDGVRYDALVVATGSRPRRLPLGYPAGVHELRTLADARILREDLVPGARLVVIGGGFVGAEVASTACALGVHVTIVEAAPAPLARVLGTHVGLMLADRWRAHGIDVRLRTGVASLRTAASGRLSSVVLTDGSELRADAALVGIGVTPARDLVPERPAAGVVTAGDVVGPGHWTAAALDGVAAARTLLGLPAPAAQPHYVWSDQFGLRLQIVGTPDPHDAIEVAGGEDAFSVRYLDGAGRMRAGVFANRPSDAADARRRLGERELAAA